MDSFEASIKQQKKERLESSAYFNKLISNNAAELAAIAEQNVQNEEKFDALNESCQSLKLYCISM